MDNKCSTPSAEDVRNAVAVIRSTLDVIVAIASSNGDRAVEEILMAAEVGIARVKAIFPNE